MNDLPFKQRYLAQWALLLVGLVITTCLSQTLSQITQLNTLQWNQFNNSLTLNQSFQNKAPQLKQDVRVLYSEYFSAPSQNNKLTQPSDSCSLASQLLPQIHSKTDWIAPFIVLALLSFLFICAPSQYLLRRHVNFPTPKRRLHVTYCVFHE